MQDAPLMVFVVTLFVLRALAYNLELRDDAVFWFYNAKKSRYFAKRCYKFKMMRDFLRWQAR